MEKAYYKTGISLPSPLHKLALERARTSADGKFSRYVQHLIVADIKHEQPPSQVVPDIIDRLARIFLGYIAPTLTGRLAAAHVDQPKLLHDLLIALDRYLSTGGSLDSICIKEGKFMFVEHHHPEVLESLNRRWQLAHPAAASHPAEPEAATHPKPTLSVHPLPASPPQTMESEPPRQKVPTPTTPSQRRPRQGDYVLKKDGEVHIVKGPDAKPASVIVPTQAKAIQQARKLEPGKSPGIERVRHTSQGKPDQWRKA